MSSEHIIPGEILGHAPGLILVQLEPIYIDRYSARPPLPDGRQRFKIDNTTIHSRPSPRRLQYRDFSSASLLSKNAHQELAYANPGTFSDILQAVSHLVDVVRSTLEFSEPAGDEHMVNNDQINDLDQAYQYITHTLQNIKKPDTQ